MGFQNLNDAVVADVYEALPSGVVGSIAGSTLAAVVPVIVRTSIDLAVKVGGPSIEALANDSHDVIRDFISEKTLEYLDGLVRGLEDVKGAG